MLLIALLLVLTGTVSAEVYLHPNESAVAICNGTMLTCVTTDTGWLRWSTPAYSKTFLSSDVALNVEINLGDITVQLTNKVGSILTSVATIRGSISSLNGTMISCGDIRTVRSIILLIPVLSELGFKALSFTSATIYWATWPSVKSECIHNYSVLVQSVRTPASISDNTTTATTSLSVTGLTRGEEYTVTVSTGQRKKTVMMTLEVADSVTDLEVEIMILNSREFIFQVSWKQPSSSHPPVLHYVVTHNVTDTGSHFPQEITHDTNITIHGVHLSTFYFIQVTPFSTFGRGHSAMRVVYPVRNMVVTAVEDPTQSMHACSCAVQLGVSLPICALIIVAGCFLTAFVTVKRNKIAFWAKALITPKPSLQAHHKNIELQVDPQVMNPNLAYEEQEPGYVAKFHPYNNANTALVKVASHVYEEPVKAPQANST